MKTRLRNILSRFLKGGNAKGQRTSGTMSAGSDHDPPSIGNMEDFLDDDGDYEEPELSFIRRPPYPPPPDNIKYDVADHDPDVTNPIIYNARVLHTPRELGGFGTRAEVLTSNAATENAYQIANRFVVSSFRGHKDKVTSLQVTDGGVLISGSSDGTCRVYNQFGELLHKYPGPATAPVNDFYLDADNKRMLTACGDAVVRVWDLEEGCILKSIYGHKGSVNSVSVPKENRGTFATASSDFTAAIWDLETSSRVMTFAGHTGPITSLKQMDDQKIAYTGSWDNSIGQWDPRSGKLIRMFKQEKQEIRDIAVTGRNIFSACMDGKVRHWDVRGTNGLIATYDCGDEWLYCCHSTDEYVYVGGDDSYIRAWNFKTKRLDICFSGSHTNGISSIYINDGLMYSGSLDKSVVVWDLLELKLTARESKRRYEFLNAIPAPEDADENPLKVPDILPTSHDTITFTRSLDGLFMSVSENRKLFELEEIKVVLHKYWRTLKYTFRFYCFDEERDPAFSPFFMSQKQFILLVEKIKVLSNVVKKEDTVNMIIQRVNSFQEVVEEPEKGDNELTWRGFYEALVLISSTEYPMVESVGERFLQLITGNILPYASCISIRSLCKFYRMCTRPDIVALVKHYTPKMIEIFNKFAEISRDVSDRRKRPKMNYLEFLAFCDYVKMPVEAKHLRKAFALTSQGYWRHDEARKIRIAQMDKLPVYERKEVNAVDFIELVVRTAMTMKENMLQARKMAHAQFNSSMKEMTFLENFMRQFILPIKIKD